MADELDELEHPTQARADDPGASAHPAGAPGRGPHPGNRHPGATAGPDGKKHDHKTQIIVIASVAGVILAWLSYRGQKAKAAAAAATTDANGNPYLSTAAAQGANGAVAGSGDPSASAGFNSYMQNLQAEIDALNSSVSDLTDAQTTPPPVTTPPPATTPKKPIFIFKKGLHYLHNLATGATYQINPSTGALYHISPTQLAEIRSLGGKVAVTSYGKPPAKKKVPPPPAKK